MANQSKPPDEPARVVLEGVPYVGFDLHNVISETGVKRCPEGVTFPSCLRACLEFMGEDYGHRKITEHNSTWRLDNLYVYLMGTTGAAFRLNWKPGWHRDNVALFLMSGDPGASFRRGFEAVGYAWEGIMREDIGYDAPDGQFDSGNEAYFRQRIIESIRDRGCPVLAHGVVGPPECCIITGYDEDGDVLIGWSFFQNDPDSKAGVKVEPSGYFRKGEWYQDTWDLMIIGKKGERPPLSKVYHDALKWALKVVRTPVTYGDRHNGLAAYEAWAAHLLRDDEFPADDMAVLRERHMVHDDAVGTVAEGRWYATQFLKQITEHEPAMAEELLAAAACYEVEHHLMWDIWNLVGGIGRSDEHVRKLAEPAIRRQIALLIPQSRHKDAEAADYIERALAMR